MKNQDAIERGLMQNIRADLAEQGCETHSPQVRAVVKALARELAEVWEALADREGEA